MNTPPNPINTPSEHLFLTENNISRLMFTMALPAMAAGFIDLTYNVVDSIFVGHFVGNRALAALSLVNSIQIFFAAVGQLFAVGSTSIISRALGANKPLLAENTLKHGFWASLAVSSLVSFTLLSQLDWFLSAMGANPETLPYAKSYGGIILWTAFVGPVNNILISSLRAKGLLPLATRYVFVGALSNIALDALFIVGFGWGGAGAAAATALSQFFVMFLAIKKVKEIYNIRLRLKERYSFPILFDIMLIGLPSGIRLFLFSFQLTLANKNLSTYGGVTALSSFGIIHRIMPLAGILIFGLASGGQPLLGMNFGAKLYGRVRAIMQVMIKYTIILAVPFSLLFLWAPSWLFYPFTTDPAIVSMGQTALRFGGSLHVLWSLFAIVAEILQSLGRAKDSFLLVGFYPVCLIVGQSFLPPLFGLLGIWMVSPLSFILTAAVAIFLLRKVQKYLKKEEENLKNAF